MKFAVVVSENVASNHIFRGLVEGIQSHIAMVFIVPNIPADTARNRERRLRLLRSTHWRFASFKCFEIYLSTLLHLLRGSSVRQQCVKLGLPFKKYRSAGDPNIIGIVEKLEIDVLLSAGPSILSEALISSPKLTTLNCHCARLPNFKGPANYVWMCLAKVTELYVAIQVMTADIDEGPVIHERCLPMNPDWSVYELNWTLSKFAGSVYGEFCQNIVRERGIPKENLQIDFDYAPIKNRGFPGKTEFSELSESGIPFIRISDLWRFY